MEFRNVVFLGMVIRNTSFTRISRLYSNVCKRSLLNVASNKERHAANSKLYEWRFSRWFQYASICLQRFNWYMGTKSNHNYMCNRYILIQNISVQHQCPDVNG